jgi:signal transduction histidine kinase
MLLLDRIIAYGLPIIGILLVTVVVYLSNHRAKTNQLFIGFNLSAALWLGTLFIADTVNDDNTALWLVRLAVVISKLMALFFLFFSINFPDKVVRISKRQVFAIVSPAFLLGGLALSPYMIQSVILAPTGASIDAVSPLYIIDTFVLVAYFITALYFLWKQKKFTSYNQKRQINLVITGVFIALVINLFTNFLYTYLTGNKTINLYGTFSLFVFVCFTAYAIIKHKLFDIRLVVARSFGYLLFVVALVITYSLFAFATVNTLLSGVSPSQSVQQIIYTLLAVLLAFSFHPLKKVFDKLSNRVFYRDAYDAQEFIDELNKLLVSTYDLQQLLLGSSKIIESNIKADYCSFIVHPTDYADLRVIGGRAQSFSAKEVEIFASFFETQEDKVVITDAVEGRNHEFVEVLVAHDVAAIIQLSAGSEEEVHEVGYIVLGPKKSGNPYNLQDLKVLRIIGNEMVISTQNALRFEEIQKFNVTLQEKVEDATKKLKAVNKKLLDMDETKDEFISMASHQLRTPLTSVKGYISMMLDEDGGKITDMQNKMLSQAFISTQRVISLISDLLNVSRLKTGKFVVNPSKVNIVKMIEGEISQLKELAAARNLELDFEAPEHFPYLMLDEAKIRQVIMNYVDNSIYYTPAGGKINIELKDNPETVELRVVDNGIGVPEADKHHMFSKFYRANNAKKARPDGTGLGLFMAKKVVLAHGGSTIFESQEGEGSTFGFVLNKKRLEEIANANKKDNSKTLDTKPSTTTE